MTDLCYVSINYISKLFIILSCLCVQTYSVSKAYLTYPNMHMTIYQLEKLYFN